MFDFIHKTFSFRIKDKNKAKYLNQLAHKVNFVWNYCNETQIHAVHLGRKWLNYYDFHKLTTGSSKLLGLNSPVIQLICREYDARRREFHKAKLKWRSNKNSLGWVPLSLQDIHLKDDSIVFMGRKYRFWKDREIEGTLKCGSFNQDSRGRWYLNLVCEIEVQDNPNTTEEMVGIDLGLKSLATLSTGDEIEAKQFYRDLEPQLAIANRAKNYDRVRLINVKIKNRRKDYLHKESTKLIEKYGYIFIGDVSIPNLAKHKKLAKSVYDAGWGMFRAMLEYKSVRNQVYYEIISEYNTSVTCSACGSRTGPTGFAGLRIREWTCSECGVSHKRDQNSAQLILALGCQRLGVEIPKYSTESRETSWPK